MCLPAYQAEPHLAQAVESVLSQSHQDWELVVVDNASTDRTGEIAQSYDDPRVVVHRNDRTLSLADNWNLAVGKARGRYIKVLPADDLLRPECLELQAKQLEANPDVALVACRRDFIDVDGNVVLRGRGLTDLTGDHAAADVVRRVVGSGINPLGEPAAMLFRRSDFGTVGNFDASLPFPMDLELSLRLLRCGDFHGQQQPLAAFRVRNNSYTAQAKRAQGTEHRLVLRRVAADPRWGISRRHLNKGLALTRVASVKRRLLYQAVAHPSPFIRRLPSVVLNDELAAVARAADEDIDDLV